jgi:acyl-CoA thioesterase
VTPAQVARFFRRDRFAWGAGIRLEEVRPGYARARMTAARRHLNAVDVVQGGALFTLADLAFAACCNSHGTVAVAVNVNIQFVRAGLPGRLVAEAREVALSPKLSSCEVKVRDRAGELVAIFTGLAYRKKEALAERAGAGAVSSAGRPRRARAASRPRDLPGSGGSAPSRGRTPSPGRPRSPAR